MASGGEDLPSTTAANLAGNSGALSAVLSAMSRDRREAGDAVTLNALRKGVEEKEAGNACLKEGDVQGAVKHYHFVRLCVCVCVCCLTLFALPSAYFLHLIPWLALPAHPAFSVS